MRRRQFLAIVGVCGVSLSGCVGRGSEPSHPTESGDLSAEPSVSSSPAGGCQGDVERIEYRGTVTEGPISEFDLSVSEESVPVGGHVTVRLENRATTVRSTAAESTGNRNKYLLQRRSADGWQSVFRRAESGTAGWHDDAVGHAPGEGFTWHLTLTRSGLEDGWYHVCEPVTPGTYRFVYWGIDDEREALGVQFDVTGR